MDDETLKSLIASLAVVEQLAINLTHLVSREYEDVTECRVAIVDDIRQRLETLQRQRSVEAQSLASLALDHLDRIEPRILGACSGRSVQ